ncbi:MAG: adenosine kinase [Pseudomonadota bacterium]
MTARYQIAGIGNAVMDVLSHADDDFLDMMGIEKGIMQLVERERAEVLYAAMDDRKQTPGGSVANTLAGLSALGLNTAFIGLVRDDAVGRHYIEGMDAAGTAFVNPPAQNATLPSSRSMIFVSPDGERSMNTYLGVSAELGPEDVPDEAAQGAELLFLEGYLFDKDKGKEAFLRAARLCAEGGGKAGIALSDPFCVDRHREDFRRLIHGDMAFVIGNEAEWIGLYQTQTLEEALTQAARECEIVVCTRSGDPVILISGDERVEVPVHRVVPVDATGAGDQFAAGFLYGLATGRDLATCGRMGVIAAAEVIGHIGPRPEANVRALFVKAGLL